MPLFEIVLLHNGDREIRLTDQPARVGDTIRVNDEEWVVKRSVVASAHAEARFECVPLQPSPTAQA